ncbi:hypothetical protein ACGC1H_002144 [Rhizoctonia solani]
MQVPNLASRLNSSETWLLDHRHHLLVSSLSTTSNQVVIMAQNAAAENAAKKQIKQMKKVSICTRSMSSIPVSVVDVALYRVSLPCSSGPCRLKKHSSVQRKRTRLSRCNSIVVLGQMLTMLKVMPQTAQS